MRFAGVKTVWKGREIHKLNRLDNVNVHCVRKQANVSGIFDVGEVISMFFNDLKTLCSGLLTIES
jgi:hypothetical protein